MLLLREDLKFLMICAFFLTQCYKVTDRQTDGRTEMVNQERGVSIPMRDKNDYTLVMIDDYAVVKTTIRLRFDCGSISIRRPFYMRSTAY